MDTDYYDPNQISTEKLTHSVIGSAIEVQRHLGAGLLEVIYERAMSIELDLRGIPYRAQVAVPLSYRGVPVGDYFADLLIAGRLLVELESVSAFHRSHIAQTISYLRATNLRLGLLLNFGMPVLTRGGVKRVIL